VSRNIAPAALSAPEPNIGLSADMQISNILQQPADIVMPKCINHRPHCAVEPFLKVDIPILEASADGMVGEKSLSSQWYYRSSHVTIRPILCITFKYTRFHIAARQFYHFCKGKDLYFREATPVHNVRPRGFGGIKSHPRGPGAPRG